MKAVAVIGYKGSGKTLVASTIIRGLRERGYRVAAIKHVHERLRLPPSDSSKFYEAGAERVIALGECEWEELGRGDRRLWEVLMALRGYDYVVVEGFKATFPGPRIVVARELKDAKSLSSPLVIAYSGPIARSKKAVGELGAPVVDPEREPERLVKIVMEKGFEPPAGLDCGFCRHGSCMAMAIAIARGDAKPSECVALNPLVSLRVNGVEIPLNPFVQEVFANVVSGLVRSLRGAPSRPSDIEVRVKLGPGERLDRCG